MVKNKITHKYNRQEREIANKIYVITNMIYESKRRQKRLNTMRNELINSLKGKYYEKQKAKR